MEALYNDNDDEDDEKKKKNVHDVVTPAFNPMWCNPIFLRNEW